MKEKEHITVLEDERGACAVKQQNMEELAVAYFSNLFQAQQIEEDIDNFFTNTKIPNITPNQAEELCQPFTRTEVVKAHKDMQPSKALGLDGFHVAFYQKFWYLIGKDVTKAILDNLNNGKDFTS